MAYFSDNFGITESDEEYSISNSLGVFDETKVYNGLGKNDQKTWGNAVAETNGRLEFSKKYLYFTFELIRSSVNEMSSLYQGNLVLNDNPNFTFPLGGAEDGKTWMYTSQADELLNVAGSDKNMLIRVKIPTEYIYNIGEITKIAFWVYHKNSVSGQEYDAYKDWNLNNTTILKSYQWNDNGWGKDYITRGGAYSNKKIAPKPSYTGSVNIYSKVYGSDNETDCGKKYFTKENGIIKVDINNLKFFSTSIRIPTDLYFEGIDENDNSYYKWVHIADNELTSGNTYKTFNSNNLEPFKKINKVYLCFGGDKVNKISCKTFENGFWNSDIPDNVKISFSLTSGTSNKLLKTPERTQNTGSYEMQSILNGEFSLGSEYPFEFSSDPFLHCTSCDNNLTQEDVSLSTGQYTMTSSSFKIHYSENYSITESSNKINFLSQCKLKAGKYTLKCNIKNKLKTDSNSYQYTFTLSDNKEIKIVADPESKYLFFGGDFPSINFYNSSLENGKTSVGGTIIIQNENLDFNFNLNATNFRIYTANPSSDEKQSPIKTLSLPEYIGLHKDYYNASVTGKRAEVSLNTSNTSNTSITSISHKTIYEEWFGEPNEQQTFYISYIFNYMGTLIYTPPFKFILGRIKIPIYDGLKVEDKTIKYFLTDNGSDQIISLKNKKSQNSFIEDKINNNKDFSMSRNTPNASDSDMYAKERLSLVFFRGEKEIGKVFIKIKKQVSKSRQATVPTVDVEYELNDALNLLKTGQINTIDFKPILTLLSETEKAALISSPFDLKIVLEYMYNISISQSLFEIELKNINFSPDVVPIGLRNGGVIINPKDNGNEQLNAKDKEGKKDTFIINVNQVQKTGSSSYEEINGLKITFNVPNTNQTSGEITLEETATFEIYLDEKGIVHLSNCVIDPAPTAET